VRRGAFGPRAWLKVLTLRGAMPREERARQALCADIDGFNLHAAVRVEAHDHKRLEQLCRYITRPALSDVGRTGAAQWRQAGGAQAQDALARRHDAFGVSPPEFMQRLAALVRRPRVSLISLVSA
jgi:hypothetical protein